MVDDRLWELIAPLIPPQPPPRGPGGSPRIKDRAPLEGILFVLHTGCRWRDLPVELGGGSGHAAWRRLRAWQEAGVWEKLHRTVLEEPSKQEILDWSRASIDAVSVRAKRGGELTGPNPTGRGKPGTKYHLLTNATGLPLHTYWPQQPTRTTASSLSRCWRPIRQCAFAVVAQGSLAAGRRSCTRTRVTTTPGAAATCIGGASRFGSPGAAPRPRPIRAGTPGRGAHHFLGAAVQAPRASLRPHRGNFAPAAPCSPSRSSPSADRARRPSYETNS